MNGSRDAPGIMAAPARANSGNIPGADEYERSEAIAHAPIRL
jgi:hypothetical protein